ncbi:Pv-fam-d protein [Plasmodium vivax Mauritania I]|uniref:Pv-fam-d protein n=1 Tax=Plasmodium vivax Mauritania I TaxID=1035515 RepID=A0A0J9TLP1_PLAVI|nr:Pv-fam-d protein [Plasmodium vivax Mauritania I]
MVRNHPDPALRFVTVACPPISTNAERKIRIFLKRGNDDKKNQSYYDRDGKKNQSYYDLYDQKKSQSSYYDREEDEERYTKRTREAVKGDNVRNRMEELKNMNSYEAQMCANRSSDMLQRGNNFQTGNNFQRGNNFQKDNMPIPQQRRQSFGDTASQYSNKKKSSNPIKNFFQRIDRKVEKELLRSMYPQITGDNNHSQKNKSFSGKLKSAYSRFKIFTPVLGIVISAIIMTAEGYEFAPLFFAIAIIIIIYLIFKLRKVNKMIEAAYEDEEDEDEPAPKGLPNSAAMGRGLPNSAAMMRGIPNGGAPMMRGGMPNGGVAVIRPMTNGGIPVMRPMTNGAPMARPMANGASPMMRPMPNGQGNSWAPESNNRRRY